MHLFIERTIYYTVLNLSACAPVYRKDYLLYSSQSECMCTYLSTYLKDTEMP